jgi:serine/threonine-protein kinase
MVHLDLKPENLLIQDGTLLKITDFGLAHRVRLIGGNYERKYGGSWPYAAPERFEQQPCDTRSDMFSVGVILHEMLTGKFPYPFILVEDPALAYAQLAEFHAKNGMDSIADRLYYRGLSGLSSDVASILSTFLQRQRHERPNNFSSAVSLLHESGVCELPRPATALRVSERLERVAALQAVGERSAALAMLNQLLIGEPENREYLAAMDSLVATAQGDLARALRRYTRRPEPRDC